MEALEKCKWNEGIVERGVCHFSGSDLGNLAVSASLSLLVGTFLKVLFSPNNLLILGIPAARLIRRCYLLFFLDMVSYCKFYSLSGKPFSHSPLYQNKNNTVFYGAHGHWARARRVPLNLNQVFEGQGRVRVREGCLRGRIMGEGNLVVSLVSGSSSQAN